jgi:hypothetical protein
MVNSIIDYYPRSLITVVKIRITAFKNAHYLIQLVLQIFPSTIVNSFLNSPTLGIDDHFAEFVSR